MTGLLHCNHVQWEPILELPFGNNVQNDIAIRDDSAIIIV